MESLKTGDIVLFNGSYLSSFVVKVASRSKWSHVGMVWENPPGYKEGRYLLSSDITMAENGVQILPLEEMIRDYRGEVWIKNLYIVKGNRYDIFASLNFLFKQTRGVDYNFFPPDIIRLINKSGCSWRRKATNWFVCSTYVAYLYTKLGVICRDNDWSVVHPKDFVEAKSLPWVNCYFSALRRIK